MSCSRILYYTVIKQNEADPHLLTKTLQVVMLNEETKKPKGMYTERESSFLKKNKKTKNHQ